MSDKIDFVMELESNPVQTGSDELPIGDYIHLNLEGRDQAWVLCDRLSVTINTPGLAVYLYPKDWFQGDPWILRESTKDDQGNDEKIIPYNKTSFSVRVINTNAIRIYGNTNYEGDYKDVQGQYNDIPEMIGQMDSESIGSMLIPAGMIVTYYQGEEFKFLLEDTPDLSNSFIPDEDSIITVKKLSDAIDELNANNQEEAQIDNWDRIQNIFSITSS